MSLFDGLIDNLNNIGNRPDHVNRRSKLMLNIGVLLVLPVLLILNGAEIFYVVGFTFSLFMAARYMIVGDMTFIERWYKMFKTFMIYALVFLTLAILIENLFPSIAPIMNYSIK